MIHAATSNSQPESVAATPPPADLVQQIVRRAFAAEPAEELLLLRLTDQHRLTAGEIARIWDCEERAITRAAEIVRRRIAQKILSELTRTQPRLQLGWGDVLAVCRRAPAADRTRALRREMTTSRKQAQRPFTREPACAR